MEPTPAPPFPVRPSPPLRASEQAAPRVLVVDDRPANLLALGAILDPLGLHLVTAGSAEEALARLDDRLALVLVDVHMPEVDGIDLARRIKKQKQTRHVPILFLTANDAERDDIVRAYEAGAVDFLTKPLDPDVVRAKVTALVELSQAREEVRGEQARLAREKALLETFYRFSRRIAAALDARELAEWAVAELCEFAQASACALYGPDPERGEAPSLLATRGVIAERLPAVLDEGEPVDLNAALEKPAGPFHQLSLPLVHAGRTLGAVYLARSSAPPFSRRRRKPVDNLVSQTAVALANVSAFANARRQASIKEALLEATGDAITMLDNEDRPVFVNQRMLEITRDVLGGYPEERTFLERQAGVAGHLTDPAGYAAAAKRIAADPELVLADEWEVAASGRTFARYTAPVRDAEGTVIGRLVTLREVTGERELERLKSELIATVSHELRTPLSSILGFAELLVARDLDGETRSRYLETIQNEAKRLTGLINNLLDLQRIEEGRLTLDIEPFDLRDVLSDQVDLAARQSAVHDVELESPDEPLVVVNMLSNAIKYSPAGGPVKVAAAHRRGSVFVSVSDCGIGIPADQQSQIFTKFFRADTSDTRRIGGTGLGLALSREIVAAHGGRVGFESVSGEGSTFWFELPMAHARAGDGRGYALVIEDDPGAAALLTEYLAQAGFEVEVAATGAEGLAKAFDDPPTFVTLDIGLPGELDGWEVLAQLKANPATADTPVFVCTAGNNRERASALGASDFLVKPFTEEQLHDTVSRLVGGERETVLMIGGDEHVQGFVRGTLDADGIVVRAAANAEEALAAVAEQQPNAIVLDLLTPGLDAFAVLESLREHPSTHSIPVVALTGIDLSSGERAELRSRAVSLLEKSEYSAGELAALIERGLGS